MTDRTVAQSVDRWKSYFPPKDQEGAKEERRTIGGREIISMTLRGSYTFQASKAKPGYRFIGTLIPCGNQFILVRMVGPDRLVQDATDDYRKMIEEALKDGGEK
ncbi:MAG: hypothetical protein JWM68_3022 [Verrucomicrobiales bacterium]|nr:hypothetical protein [Verrucomicrobiales bacterium]